MPDYDYDLMVIGGGSAGVRAARVASQLGAKVALCEMGPLGGTCVNVGCVPKKLFVYGSHFAQDWLDARGFGWSGEVSFDWPTLLRNKDGAIKYLNGVYQSILDKAGVELLIGRATLTGANEVSIAGQKRTAERILVATGGQPLSLDLPGVELAHVSDDVFSMPALPKRALVIGGGYIATEFASVFSLLGVEVTLVHRGEEILRGFDKDVRCHLHKELEREGVVIRLNCEVSALRKVDGGIEATCGNGDKVLTDYPLLAVGREPNTGGLGLEEVGVSLGERRGVIVNKDFQSSVPSVYAIGDVIDQMQLTPVAIAEGMHFAHHFYGKGDYQIDYEGIPTAVFSQPEIATVGLSEEEARNRFERVQVFRSTFTPLKLMLSEREERTLQKIIVDEATDRVVGCHMVGPGASEIVQGLAIALKAGATKAQFDATVGIHPTSAEEFVTAYTPVEPE